MFTNRLTSYLEELEAAPSAPVIPPESGFAIRPLFFAVAVPVPWQMDIYRLAYEQAKAAVEARQRVGVMAHRWN